MNKNRIEAYASGELATYNEAHIHQGRGCRFGGCALKAVELTSGDLLRVVEPRLRLLGNS